MQIAANTRLVRNRVRVGTGFHLAALGVFALGLLVSSRTDPAEEVPWVSWLTIGVGVLFYALGQSQLRRWGPRHRQEEQLAHAVRSLDDRYKLYAFLSSSLPDYIVVSPAGVTVLVARGQKGLVSCQRDQWQQPGRRRFLAVFANSLGNPSAEARVEVEKVRAALAADGHPDVPVSGLLVFTNPAVQLKLEGCGVTATKLKELKDVLRRAAGRGSQVALPAAQVRQIQALFDGRMQSAGRWR